MNIVVLTKDMREDLLTYDINHTEHSFDRDMYYATTSEKDILHDIIDGWIGYRDEILIEFGFDEKDLDKLRDGKFSVEFTGYIGKEKYCIVESE